MIYSLLCCDWMRKAARIVYLLLLEAGNCLRCLSAVLLRTEAVIDVLLAVIED